MRQPTFRLVLILLTSLAGSLLLPASNTGLAQGNLSLAIGRVENTGFPDVLVEVTVREQGFALHGLNANHFAVYEDNNRENLLTKVEELQDGSPLTITLVFDANPTPGTAGYREMQEFAQVLVGEILGAEGRDQIEIRVSADRSAVGPTNDLNAVVTAIRKMVVEDFQTGRRLNDVLAETLQSNNSDRRRVILVLGPGSRQTSKLDRSSVTKIASDQRVPIYTLAFGEYVDEEYLRALATETGGRFMATPSLNSVSQFRNEMVRRLKTHYLISYRSKLYQIDSDAHEVSVEVNWDGQQDSDEALLTFPASDNRTGVGMEPLVYLWGLICGVPIAILSLVVLVVSGKLKF